MKQSLFRSIRRKLLDEGKLVRYLTYAVGEVLLIIVGILLSLKIYDWNEDQKAQAEFDEYIVQLKEDVREAIEIVDRSKSITQRISKRVEYVPAFLELKDYSSDELKAFEAGLSSLPVVNIPQVKVGLLGPLLEGKMDIISRDPSLAREALEMESSLEGVMGVIQGHSERMVLATVNRVSHFLGTGEVQLNGTVRVPPKYDLERLKADEEFLYVINHVQSLRSKVMRFDDNLTKELQSFLAVLDEYQ